MSAHLNCRVCSTSLPPPFLDLGEQPPANSLLKSPDDPCPKFPLAATRCTNCGLVQLTYNVDPNLLFGEYLYTTGISASFRKHFAEMAETIDPSIEKLVVTASESIAEVDDSLAETVAALLAAREDHESMTADEDDAAAKGPPAK